MSLRVDELTVYYRTLRGDVRALDGVTFDISDGEIMGLAGESGCGKSTLGKSLIRLDGRMRHIGGSVTLDGRVLPLANDRGMNEFRFKQVSIVPQYAMSALNPTRKVGKITEELLESRGVDFDEVRPELVRRLELVGLSDDVLGMFPIELSGGMKQRAVMVLSTLLNPSLLIADEVTSALDVSTQRAVAEMLVEFRDRSFVKSVVVITHDLVDPLPDRRHDPRDVRRATRREGGGRRRHLPAQASLHAAPGGVAARGRRALRGAAAEGIPGRPPSLLDPPTGCRFRDRCPLAFAKCAEEPPFVEIEPGHHVACWAVS